MHCEISEEKYSKRFEDLLDKGNVGSLTITSLFLRFQHCKQCQKDDVLLKTVLLLVLLLSIFQCLCVSHLALFPFIFSLGFFVTSFIMFCGSFSYIFGSSRNILQRVYLQLFMPLSQTIRSTGMHINKNMLTLSLQKID